MAKQTQEQIIEEVVSTLLEKLGVSAEYEIVTSDELIDVILTSDEGGMLIGYHGEVLESMQLILSLMIAQKTGNYVRVSVEVGDYKKNRTDYLNNLVSQTKERALQQGGEVTLPNLKSWERRIIHMALQDDPEVVSESVGEGKDRTLVIKPRVS